MDKYPSLLKMKQTKLKIPKHVTTFYMGLSENRVPKKKVHRQKIHILLVDYRQLP